MSVLHTGRAGDTQLDHREGVCADNSSGTCEPWIRVAAWLCEMRGKWMWWGDVQRKSYFEFALYIVGLGICVYAWDWRELCLKGLSLHSFLRRCPAACSYTCILLEYILHPLTPHLPTSPPSGFLCLKHIDYIIIIYDQILSTKWATGHCYLQLLDDTFGRAHA